MKLLLFACLFAIINFARENSALKELQKTNRALLKALKALTSTSETKVGNRYWITDCTQEMSQAGCINVFDRAIPGNICSCYKSDKDFGAEGNFDEYTEQEVADGDRGMHGGPHKDCYSFNKDCVGCRGYLDSCCSDKNCGGGRTCKAGIWSYSCDNQNSETALAETRSKMVYFVGRTNECDWNNVDSANTESLGGGGYDENVCLQACKDRTLCNFAAVSSDGYCHMFETCEGQGGNGWKIFYKETRPEYLTDKGYGITVDGDGCNSGRITDELTCMKATEELGGTYGKSYSIRSDPPGCLFANDGRYKVYFNTDLQANGHNSKYQEICEASYCTSPRKGKCNLFNGHEKIFVHNVNQEQCFVECAKYAATDGDGCCHYGPENTWAVNGKPTCFFSVHDEMTPGKPDWYGELVRVSKCGASVSPPPPAREGEVGSIINVPCKQGYKRDLNGDCRKIFNYRDTRKGQK